MSLPFVISHIINGLSRALINEESMGLTQGDAEVLAFAERWRTKLEMKRRPSDPPRRDDRGLTAGEGKA